MKRIYCDIQKSEEQSDGTIIVSGVASAPTEDADGEIVTSGAMEAALPDYMKFGAVREMHQVKAAGTALEAFVDEQGFTQFTAHVVDSEAVKKVKNKVYKGFSIGGKVLERDASDPNTITAIKLVEISLVDRPNNPDSIFTMYKAEGIDQPHSKSELDAIAELSALVNKGAIVPSKLVELAQTFIKGVLTMDLQKSLWDVAELARLLGQLKSVQSCLAFDAAYEGEISPASQQLKQNIADLAATLVALIGEEVPEATAAAAGEGEVADQTVTEAEGAEDVAEADGAKTPADDSGEPGGDPVVDKDDDGGDMEEAENPNDGATTQPRKTKKAEPIGDLAKAIGAAVTAAIEPLAKRISELEAMPAPSKAVLKVVGKASDTIEKADKVDEEQMPSGLSPADAAAWEIKKLHRSGGLLG